MSDGATGSNTEKNPEEWTTGDEPMTGAQASYLKTLSDEAGEPFDEGLTKAEASLRIDQLQQKTGRGQGTSSGERRDEEPQADAATGQVIDPSYEEEVEEESAPPDLPRPEDVGAVDRDGSSSNASQ